MCINIICCILRYRAYDMNWLGIYPNSHIYKCIEGEYKLVYVLNVPYAVTRATQDLLYPDIGSAWAYRDTIIPRRDLGT